MPGVITEPATATKAPKLTKNQLRRQKNKEKKAEQKNAASTKQPPDNNHPVKPVLPAKNDPIQDVPDVASPDLEAEDALAQEYLSVFKKFEERGQNGQVEEASDKPQVFFDDDDNIADEEEEVEVRQRLSKKARRNVDKLSIAELKAVVRKPEIVEWWDVDSIDPKLLVHLKATRNVIPVPGHWSLKREYLSSKRGIEKANFRLPQFIAETGIAEMRQTELDANEKATLKQKARARVNPKIGRLDVDYQKLFEAFFRRQTKPHLSRFGEVYYEGKEDEANLRHLRPGDLSDSLREALNMPAGAPPPWLINQQRFGCPPSYPAMKIPGVNAPPPPGGQWGFEPGQYGKPPTEEGDPSKPKWGGDLFGTEALKRHEAQRTRKEKPVSRALWGELQTLEEEDAENAMEDSDEEEEEDEEPAANVVEEEISYAGTETPMNGMQTEVSKAGIQSEFDLRKKTAGGHTTEEPRYPRSAGQVLQERSIRAEGFFGGERAYDLKNADLPMLGDESADRGRKRKAGDLDVSVDIDALGDDGLSKDALRKQYDEGRQRERHGQWPAKVDQEDLSAMIAEENAKRLKRNQE